jgi:hypothetical protein
MVGERLARVDRDVMTIFSECRSPSSRTQLLYSHFTPPSTTFVQIMRLLSPLLFVCPCRHGRSQETAAPQHCICRPEGIRNRLVWAHNVKKPRCRRLHRTEPPAFIPQPLANEAQLHR